MGVTIPTPGVGSRIRRIRAELIPPIQQNELAEIIGVNRFYISKIELGSRKPGAKLLDKIADKLSVSRMYLFSGTGEPFPFGKPTVHRLKDGSLKVMPPPQLEKSTERAVREEVLQQAISNRITGEITEDLWRLSHSIDITRERLARLETGVIYRKFKNLMKATTLLSNAVAAFEAELDRRFSGKTPDPANKPYPSKSDKPPFQDDD